MKKVALLTVLIVCSMALISCGKRYVGLTVDTRSNPYWCNISSLPYTCRNGTEKDICIVNSTIAKGTAEGRYIAEGVVDFSQGTFKSWGNLQDAGTRFAIVLAKDGVIVDTHSFMLRTMGSAKEVPFSVDFECPGGFDAVTFVGEATIR